MPDFERLTDGLRIWAARGPVQRAWAQGYRAGKTRARIEVLVIVVLLYLAVAAVGRYFGAQP